MTTPRITRRTLTALLASAAAFPMANSAFAQDRPVIAAVNYPLAYFAERLMGDSAEILFPVPADVDPSFWKPGITDISALQAADLIALNGAGFATWTTKVSLPRSRTLDTSAAFSDSYISTETVTHSHGEGGEHSHTDVANYLWLDFALAAQQAQALAAGLIRKFPDAETAITQNLDALLADLVVLDASASELAGMIGTTTAIASHPRYQYFSRAYGLDMSAMAWEASAEVSEDQWQDLAAQISQTGATLFVWEATPTADARARIKDMGLVDVVFPPLANRPASGDFVSVMAASIERMKTVLSA